MASRGDRSNGGAGQEAAELKAHVAAACSARREDHARIKAALVQIQTLIARRNELVRKTSHAHAATDTETDVIRQLAAVVEDVRDLVLNNELRLQAVEGEMLRLIHEAAYASRPAAAQREASLHVPAPTSADLDRLGEETGVAWLSEHASAVTCTFACPL